MIMKKISTRLLALLMTLLFTSLAIAKAPVWKVSKAEEYLYLGGTIHLLSEDDYPLPTGFDTAYENTDNIVLETNLAALEAPEVQGRLLNAMSYQDHRGLSNVLDRDVYDQLDALLKSKGIPVAVFDRFTPAGAMMALTQYELQRLGLIGDDGVDIYFSKQAIKDGKEASFLESFEEQLGFIKSMNQLEPNKVIKSGLKDIAQLESTWSDLLNAWKTGDLMTLEELAIRDMKRDFPNMYQTVLVKRNEAWLEEIKAMMLTKDKEFVLVGALHMAGEEGLVNRLKAVGYIVKQLD